MKLSVELKSIYIIESTPFLKKDHSWKAEINTDISLNTWRVVSREAHLMNSRREFRWKVIIRYFWTLQITAEVDTDQFRQEKIWTANGDHTRIFLVLVEGFLI